MIPVLGKITFICLSPEELFWNFVYWLTSKFTVPVQLFKPGAIFLRMKGKEIFGTETSNQLKGI